MTLDEQLVLVCEKLLGWKPFKVRIDDEWSPNDGEYRTWWKDSCGLESPLPPLTLDLMWECEMQAMELWGFGFQATYLLHLQNEVERMRRDLNHEQISVWMMCATKEQRLTALVETIKGTR